MERDMSDVKFLRYRDLAAKGIPFKRSHLRRLILAGKFPQPVAMGVATNSFIESEVDEYIAAKIAERPAYRAMEAA
jgi:prophage regulatory protein